jgi:D-alanyl-lipoteichoic acid acyltransferase DltB (MBOAT superfamily)
MKRLKEFIPEKLRFFDVLWLGAPVAIWFAYQPLIRLGQDGTMYYELSVTMLYAALLALVSLPSIWRHRHELVKLRAAWVVEVFVVISLLGLMWTMNLTRGILTAGVTGMLYGIFLGAMAERVRLKQLLPSIVRVYLYSALVMCGLAIVQFFSICFNFCHPHNLLKFILPSSYWNNCSKL